MGTLVNSTKTLLNKLPMTYNADDEVFRHHSSDIDLIEQLLDEPDIEYDWTPISRD